MPETFVVTLVAAAGARTRVAVVRHDDRDIITSLSSVVVGFGGTDYWISSVDRRVCSHTLVHIIREILLSLGRILTICVHAWRKDSASFPTYCSTTGIPFHAFNSSPIGLIARATRDATRTPDTCHRLQFFLLLLMFAVWSGPYSALQSADIGWPTGNGKKLCNGQACCLAQLCLAAA